jgi:hypothetical protein
MLRWTTVFTGELHKRVLQKEHVTRADFVGSSKNVNQEEDPDQGKSHMFKASTYNSRLENLDHSGLSASYQMRDEFFNAIYQWLDCYPLVTTPKELHGPQTRQLLHHCKAYC